jgi:glyoxylase-like metal-dependent hydrolase (beta-lactamase superfamily II)
MKIHFLRGFINNLYIAEYEHGLLLLDGASRPDIPLIEKFCKQILKRPASDIKLALVSHMHPDHSGAAPLLRKKYGTSIAAYKDIDKWYSGFSGFLQHTLDYLMTQILAFKQEKKIRQVYSPRFIKPDFPINSGDSLPFFPEWRAIHTPGHTTHDISIFHSQERILYCGDCIVEMKNRFFLPLPVIFRDKMRESYNILAALGATTILLPHGNVINTDNSRSLFTDMASLLEEPPNKIRRRVHYFSVWSPDIWKPRVRKMMPGLMLIIRSII